MAVTAAFVFVGCSIGALVVYENAAVTFGTATAPETYVFVGLARFTPPSPALDVLYDNVTIEQIP